EIARAVRERRHGQSAGLDALRRATALVVGKEEDPVPSDRAAERVAELVLVESNFVRIEEASRVERGVAQKFEPGPVECVRAGLGHDRHESAAKISGFGVEI